MAVITDDAPAVTPSPPLSVTAPLPVETVTELAIASTSVVTPTPVSAASSVTAPLVVVTDSFTTPVDVEVQAVQPHAHYRAKEMVGFAQLPDGSLRPLIHIRNWDFRWQHVYRYETPFWLPKGTRLQMRYVYDNSADNPRNPDQPPREVFWGQRSADEMGDLFKVACLCQSGFAPPALEGS